MVDLQLKKSTAEQHISHIKRFLDHLGKEPQNVTYEDIQGFLSELQTNPERILKREVEAIKPRTLCNWIKSFRRYFRDFLHKGELVKSFKFPEIQFEFVPVPSTEDLQRAYSVLKQEVERAIFLFYASTSFRTNVPLNLKIADVDFANRCVIPNNNGGSKTKRTNFSFYNEEAQKVLEAYLATRENLTPDSKLFDYSRNQLTATFRKINRKTGLHLSPKRLRAWFCTEMTSRGISDSYVDFYCGRTPQSVLARHYLDYSIQKTKQIYQSANLRVLG